MDDNSVEMVIRGSSEPTNYAFSGKVMLATVVILAVVCILIAFFHMYSRWFLLSRAATHHISSSISTLVTPQGLDPIVFKSLSNFNYSPTSNTTPFECIICLGEFEEFETCRLLPKCNHCFHLQCIDLWFQSHTNCPLCRSPVQSVSAQSESPIGDTDTADVLIVIVEVPLPVTDDRVSEGEDLVLESEGGNVFKPMAEPVRLLRRFLSI